MAAWLAAAAAAAGCWRLLPAGYWLLLPAGGCELTAGCFLLAPDAAVCYCWLLLAAGRFFCWLLPPAARLQLYVPRIPVLSCPT